MKTEELKTQGLTDEQIAFVMSENGKDVKREKDKAESFKTQLETAQEQLKTFEGKDFDKLTRERDEWKEKYTTAKNEYDEKQKAADFDKALETAVKDLKFTSESAKKAFLSELKGKKPEVKDGTVAGFDEFLKQYRETDSKAFVDEKSEQLESSKARFTAPIENNTSGRKNDDTLRRAFGLPPRKD